MFPKQISAGGTRLAGFAAMLGCGLAAWAVSVGPARAEVVAEWKFDGAEELSGGARVALDRVAGDASAQSELKPLAKVRPGPTGLGEAWQTWLRSGYLESADGGKNEAGLATRATSEDGKNARFARYLGKTGIWTHGGGTVYLAASPAADWNTDKLQGLFSSGHRIGGFVDVGVKSGAAFIAVGGMKYGRPDTAEARASYKFEIGKWYFIGASWQGGHNPVLYVREMDARGPASPREAEAGTFEKVCEIFEQPGYDPLVIGASWINTGGESFTQDGAQGRIAYARVDNTPAKLADMKAVLEGLGAAATP
jgi:hypothetical protein